LTPQHYVSPQYLHLAGCDQHRRRAVVVGDDLYVSVHRSASDGHFDFTTLSVSRRQRACGGAPVRAIHDRKLKHVIRR
jgi:hypothetical protein